MHQVNRVLFIFFHLILINFLSFASPSGLMAGETIRINGSGTCLEMIKPLMEAYAKDNRGVAFQTENPLGSSGAIKALLAGAIDIAVIGRPLNPEETARGAKSRAFGKTPLAIVISKNVPLKNISTGELEDIYFGRTLKWPDGETIRIILRPNEDTDTKILKGLSPSMAEAVDKAHQQRGMMVAVTDRDAYEAVSKTDGRIGTAGLPFILSGKLPVKVLALNGVMPSRKNLANKRYPLAKDIGFATTDKLPDAAAKFIEFIHSKKGRSLAARNGVLITAGSK